MVVPLVWCNQHPRQNDVFWQVYTTPPWYTSFLLRIFLHANGTFQYKKIIVLKGTTWKVLSLEVKSVKTKIRSFVVYLVHIVFFLSDCLWINIPPENTSITVTVRGYKTLGCALHFRPLTNRSTPAVTQGFGFSDNQGLNKIANSILKQW